MGKKIGGIIVGDGSRSRLVKMISELASGDLTVEIHDCVEDNIKEVELDIVRKEGKQSGGVCLHRIR